jgi:methylenetetrahydrofolate reductase (NADPH)
MTAADFAQRCANLIAAPSVEVTQRDPAIDDLKRFFPAGTSVHLAALPNDDPAKAEAVCGRLRDAGYDPVPHLAVRNFRNIDDLGGHVGRLTRDAGVTQALLIAGDRNPPRGPFASSLEAMTSGILPENGLRRLLVAGYPEGHPVIAAADLERVLKAKVAYGHARQMEIGIVTQFCFEAAPILDWLRRGHEAPVRIGLAGPASLVLLLKFALRCGVGHSLQALRRQGARLSRLTADEDPDALLLDLAAAVGDFAVSGVHFFPFGGVHKTGEWLAAFRRRLAVMAEGEQPAASR